MYEISYSIYPISPNIRVCRRMHVCKLQMSKGCSCFPDNCKNSKRLTCLQTDNSSASCNAQLQTNNYNVPKHNARCPNSQPTAKKRVKCCTVSVLEQENGREESESAFESVLRGRPKPVERDESGFKKRDKFRPVVFDKYGWAV